MTINYWAAKSIKDQLKVEFSDIRNEETMWHFYRDIFGPTLFFDMPYEDAMRALKA